MTDPDPYTPPAVLEDALEIPSNRDTVLRRVGALCLAYVAVRAMWWNWGPDAPAVPMPVWSVAGGVAMMGLWIYGFLRGRRKFHLGIALYMALSLAMQAYLVARVVAHPERIPAELLSERPWLEFALGSVPLAIPMVCAAVLYVRARRAGRRDLEVEPQMDANGREI